MAKNDVKVTDNPKLKQKELSDGNFSLYLDFYLGRVNGKVQRKREFLGLTILASPRTPIERTTNKQTLELANRIRAEREQELKNDTKGYRLKKEVTINFLEYFENYIKDYNKKDIRMIDLALRRFKDFLADTPEYIKFRSFIKPEQLNKDMMEDFVDYLQSRSKGEGAKSIYQRFKKVINYAIEHDVITKNPCTGVTIKVDDQILRKDVLSLEEIKQMLDTKVEGQSDEIRRAFIFCLYTGIRFCDVKELTFENVDYSNKILKFEQSKTKGHSGGSGVIIPLNDGLLNLIGQPKTKYQFAENIFNLPSHTMCLKSLQRWVKASGINKHITWHCARHSFAVNILNNGANIKTVASLLGHSGLRHTEKYTRAVDKLKEEAINSLPELNF